VGKLPAGCLSPRQVCERTGFSMDRVLKLIHGKYLPAVNTAPYSAKRATWLIREIDLERFLTPDLSEVPERSQLEQKPQSPSPRRRARRRLDEGLKKYV